MKVQLMMTHHKYKIREKFYTSPENNNDENGLTATSDEIMSNLTQRSLIQSSIFDMRIEFSMNSKTLFLEALNNVLDPNSFVPIEFSGIQLLRRAIYNLGHNLEKGLGFANLEKLGFTMFSESDRCFILGDQHTKTPEDLTSDNFFEGISHLFEYLSDQLLNESYLWSIGEYSLYAASKKNQVLSVSQTPRE